MEEFYLGKDGEDGEESIFVFFSIIQEIVFITLINKLITNLFIQIILLIELLRKTYD